jgi:hypothetical protein
LPHAGGFLWVLHHENDISEISLKVASNTITPILILSAAKINDNWTKNEINNNDNHKAS